MSAKDKALKAALGESTKETAQTFGERAIKALSAPQRYLSKKAAEVAGLKDAGSSEQNFANIADAAGDALGVPRDSTLGNAAKAAAVAGAEVFADPLNAIGMGPLAKVASKAPKALKSTVKVVDSLADKIAAKGYGKVIVKPEVKLAVQSQAARNKVSDAMVQALEGRKDLTAVTTKTSQQSDTAAKQLEALSRAQKGAK